MATAGVSKLKWPRDSWLGILGMGLGVMFFLMARSIQDWAFDVLGASFFPKLSASLMFVFGLVLFVTSLSEIKSKIDEKTSNKLTNIFYANIIFIVVLIVYVAVLPLAGFIFSTVSLVLIMYFGIVKKFSARYFVQGLCFSVLSVVAIWYIFTKQFAVILP